MGFFFFLITIFPKYELLSNQEQMLDSQIQPCRPAPFLSTFSDKVLWEKHTDFPQAKAFWENIYLSDQT